MGLYSAFHEWTQAQTKHEVNSHVSASSRSRVAQLPRQLLQGRGALLPGRAQLAWLDRRDRGRDLRRDDGAVDVPRADRALEPALVPALFRREPATPSQVGLRSN